MKRVEFRLERRHGPGSLERLAAMLSRAMERPESGQDAMQWELTGDEGVVRFRFPLGPGPSAKRQACERVGRVLAEFTLTEREPQLLRRYFRSKCGIDDPVEIDALIAETLLLLQGGPDADANPELPRAERGKERRIRKLADRFAAYLAENDRIHVDGFVRFRLRDYEAEVLEAAETVLDDKRMERQYEEFMSLLKSLVEWQQTGIPAVHVLHAGGHAFRLLDEDMRPLERDGDSSGEVDEDEEGSVLVSRLLAVSPGRLHIHTPEPDSQVIRTLIGIFGDRAALHPHLP
jgi:putative sporulation protein YtxC